MLDNLNTHRMSALYDRFDADEARRVASKLEFHFTPKHTSWLNMVEIEIAVMSKQCLDCRIPSFDLLSQEIDAWQNARNAEQATINWLFDIDKARIKLKLGRSYLTPSSCVPDAAQPQPEAESTQARPARVGLSDSSKSNEAAAFPRKRQETTLIERCATLLRRLGARLGTSEPQKAS